MPLLANDGALLKRKIVWLTEDDSFLTDKTALFIDEDAPRPVAAVYARPTSGCSARRSQKMPAVIDRRYRINPDTPADARAR
jgi:hypothetical protein